MQFVKDIKASREITLTFTESELKLLTAIYGNSTSEKQEESYQSVFDEVMPVKLESSNLYFQLYEIIMNPTDVVKGNSDGLDFASDWK